MSEFARNFVSLLDDEHLAYLYNEWVDWKSNECLPMGGDLGDLYRKYKKSYGAKLASIALENDFLSECALRYTNIIEDNNKNKELPKGNGLKMLCEPTEKVKLRGYIFDDELENKLYEAICTRVVLYKVDTIYSFQVTTSVVGENSYYRGYEIDEETLMRCLYKG